MKKFLLTIILISICFQIYSNEIEVIELHESISLDQMVLQNQDNENNIEEDNTNKNTDEILSNSEDISQAPLNENEFWITSEETDSFEPFLAKIKIN